MGRSQWREKIDFEKESESHCMFMKDKKYKL